MKILNLHGFLAKADNKNYNALLEIISAEEIISPQINYIENSPQDILEMLSGLVDSEDFIFVGQSLGGWYADKLSRRLCRPCILTNPCYFPYELEIITASGIAAEYVEQYREMTEQSKNELANTLCGDADTIIPDNYVNCEKLSGSVTRVHGGHSSIEKLGEHLRILLEKIAEQYYKKSDGF